jgi:hypothetical protein
MKRDTTAAYSHSQGNFRLKELTSATILGIIHFLITTICVFDTSNKIFWQRRIVGGVVFCAVRVVPKENSSLFPHRTSRICSGSGKQAENTT